MTYTTYFIFHICLVYKINYIIINYINYMYCVRKVRNYDKYEVRIRTPDNKYLSVEHYNTREEAEERRRQEIYKQIERENEKQILKDKEDTEIEDV